MRDSVPRSAFPNYNEVLEHSRAGKSSRYLAQVFTRRETDLDLQLTSNHPAITAPAARGSSGRGRWWNSGISDVDTVELLRWNRVRVGDCDLIPVRQGTGIGRKWQPDPA